MAERLAVVRREAVLSEQEGTSVECLVGRSLKGEKSQTEGLSVSRGLFCRRRDAVSIGGGGRAGVDAAGEVGSFGLSAL